MRSGAWLRRLLVPHCGSHRKLRRLGYYDRSFTTTGALARMKAVLPLADWCPSGSHLADFYRSYRLVEGNPLRDLSLETESTLQICLGTVPLSDVQAVRGMSSSTGRGMRRCPPGMVETQRQPVGNLQLPGWLGRDSDKIDTKKIICRTSQVPKTAIRKLNSSSYRGLRIQKLAQQQRYLVV